MKQCFNALLLLMMISIVWACAHQPLDPVKWEPEKEAIKLQIKAVPDLNWSHNVHLCVYQLKDPSGFDKFAGYDEGLQRKLLHHRCELFDQTVVKSESLYVDPGEYLSLTMDRFKDAQYVAIAAGYEGPSKTRATRIIKIPVITETKGLIRRKEIKKPGHLNVEITLGREQILTFNEIKGK